MIQELKELLPITSGLNSRDVVKWRWTTSESFSVISCYNFLKDSGVLDTKFGRIWKIRILLKVKIFVWLVLLRKVLTVDNLLKRGWTGETGCVLCSVQTESLDHLFMSCGAIRSLLMRLLPNKRMLSSCTCTATLWEESRLKGGDVGRRELETIAVVWWAIWRERNKRIFVRKKISLMHLLLEIRTCSALWSFYC